MITSQEVQQWCWWAWNFCTISIEIILDANSWISSFSHATYNMLLKKGLKTYPSPPMDFNLSIHFILCGNACGKDLLESHRYSDELCLLHKVNSKCNSHEIYMLWSWSNQSCLPACRQLPWLQPFIQAKALNSCQIELRFSALKGTHHHHACMREAAEPDS